MAREVGLAEQPGLERDRDSENVESGGKNIAS